MHEHRAMGYDPLWLELCESFPVDPALADIRERCLRPPTELAPPFDRSQAERRAHDRDRGARRCRCILLPPSAGELLPVPVTMGDGRPEPVANTCRGRNHLDRAGSRSNLTALTTALRDDVGICSTRVVAADQRPIPWCLIARASQETARLMERLTESWGPGHRLPVRNEQGRGRSRHFTARSLIDRAPQPDARLVG